MVKKKTNPLKTISKGINLVSAIFDPSEENAEFFINMLFPKLDPQELAKRIVAYDKFLNDKTLDDESRRRMGIYCDPIPGLFTSFDITSYGQTPRQVLASWWPYISKILLNPETKLYPIMGRDANVASILGTKEGITYLRYLAQRDYDFFYDYITKFPRAHTGCKVADPWYASRISYGVLRSGAIEGWTYYCDKCGTPFTEEEVYDNDYTVHLVAKKSGT